MCCTTPEPGIAPPRNSVPLSAWTRIQHRQAPGLTPKSCPKRCASGCRLSTKTPSRSRHLHPNHRPGDEAGSSVAGVPPPGHSAFTSEFHPGGSNMAWKNFRHEDIHYGLGGSPEGPLPGSLPSSSGRWVAPYTTQPLTMACWREGGLRRTDKASTGHAGPPCTTCYIGFANLPSCAHLRNPPEEPLSGVLWGGWSGRGTGTFLASQCALRELVMERLLCPVFVVSLWQIQAVS